MASPRFRPAAVLFDLDGTLVDSLDDIATGVNLARAGLGLAALPRAEIVRHVGDGSDALIRRAIPEAGARHGEAVAAYARHYAEHLLDRTRLMPGALDVLRHFAGRPLAVVTNKPQHLTERLLEGLGIRDNFRLVLGGDALPRRKPDPEPLLHAIRSLGVHPNLALMVGDGVNDVQAAKSAGVPAAAVLGGVNTRQELTPLAPDFLLESLGGLVEIVD